MTGHDPDAVHAPHVRTTQSCPPLWMESCCTPPATVHAKHTMGVTCAIQVMNHAQGVPHMRMYEGVVRQTCCLSLVAHDEDKRPRVDTRCSSHPSDIYGDQEVCVWCSMEVGRKRPPVDSHASTPPWEHDVGLACRAHDHHIGSTITEHPRASGSGHGNIPGANGEFDIWHGGDIALGVRTRWNWYARKFAVSSLPPPTTADYAERRTLSTPRTGPA